jgi:hypothetical protein
MANENLCEMAPDGQAQVKTRLTNRSNWLGLSLIVAAIATLIPLITIVVFEWYFFTVVDGLATCLSPSPHDAMVDIEKEDFGRIQKKKAVKLTRYDLPNNRAAHLP